MGIFIKGMEMPQRCGQCKLYHAEHPMHCMAVEGHRTVGAPYGMPRPDWCPLVEVKESKTGHWVLDPNGMDWNLPAWVCSECKGKNDMIPTHIRGKDGMIEVKNPYRWAGSHYCPNCGAKMEVQ